MKKICLIIFIFAGIIFCQEKIVTPSGRITPPKPTDTTPPLITISEPKIIDGEEFIQKDTYLTIRGTVSDENGIKDVFVNNVKATVQQMNAFFANVKLVEGINTLIVKATDNKSNTGEKTIKITYRSDVEGPVISILEPAVSRGSTVISKKEVQTIKGLAVDQSGVLDVTVNNRKTVLNSNGEFAIDLYLTVGDNQIIVNAVDTKMNVSIDTFTIARKLEELIAGGKYYALIVGVDEYNGVWSPLRNAVNDAKAVEELLVTDYKFDEIISIYNEDATRRNIIRKFEELTSIVTKDDNVLIFYSGHGELKQQLNKGYWVPVDAKTKSTADYISNSDIQTYMSGINSKHTLLVADACFSGDIFRGRTNEIPFEDSEKYFREVYKRASRAALTSGGIEPVTDGGREGHSVFTYYLLKALKENNAKYFTAGQVFNAINIPVTNNSEQTPVFQPIKNTGDEGGQFIFIKR